jgi:activator of HSP90 ATPase
MSSRLTLKFSLPVAPDVVYRAWLSSKEHSAFTGSPARISARVGARCSAWDGYITGTIVRLEKNRKIVQTWRTAEFPDGAEDSLFEVHIEPSASGSSVIFRHTMIPTGDGQKYRDGWKEFYIEPMKEYYSTTSNRGRKQ